MTTIPTEDKIDTWVVWKYVNKLREKLNTVIQAVNGFSTDIQKNAENITINDNASITRDIALGSRIDSTNSDLSGLSSALTTLDNATQGDVKIIALNPNDSTVVIRVTFRDDTFTDINFPVASTLQAGIMNAPTYAGYIDLGVRVSALENRQTQYPVTFSSDTPTQEEITTAYTTTYPTAPNPPVTGTIVVDFARNKQYTWNGTTTEWVDTSQSIVPLATNTTPGLVQGSDVDGQIFVETNGTMSLNDYDNIITDISNNMGDIQGCINTIGKTEGTSGIVINGIKVSGATVNVTIPNVESDGVVATQQCVITPNQINGKVNINQGSDNVGKTFQVGEDGNVKLVPFPNNEFTGVSIHKETYIYATILTTQYSPYVSNSSYALHTPSVIKDTNNNDVASIPSISRVTGNASYNYLVNTISITLPETNSKYRIFLPDVFFQSAVANGGYIQTNTISKYIDIETQNNTEITIDISSLNVHVQNTDYNQLVYGFIKLS